MIVIYVISCFKIV